jgi:hypothetical protein
LLLGEHDALALLFGFGRREGVVAEVVEDVVRFAFFVDAGKGETGEGFVFVG